MSNSSNSTPSPAHLFGSEEALKRLKRRHAAERRFKLYGQIAIGVALSALLVLTYSIISQAIPAFSKHQVVFDLTLDEATVAPQGRQDTQAISNNVSGFYSLLQDDLQARFPEGAEDRAGRRELGELVTRLAVLDMAHKVARTPDMIGTTHRFTAPLADDLDLYLKGGISARSKLGFGVVPSLTPTENGQYLATGVNAEAASRAGRLLNEADDGPPSILLDFAGTWMRLETVSGTELTLSHLAGPRPSESLSGIAPKGLVIQVSEGNRSITDRLIAWTLMLKADKRIKRHFNTDLLFKADSTYPELAGAAAAIVGSIFTMLITAFFALPVGIFAAVYLEEFAPKNRLTDVIEVNINNLAAVPSIIFGLLGAAVFVNFFGMPRSVPMVGGLVLGLLVLPTVIIASRAALKSVPPSIRTAALGLGASKTQAVFHHTLPLAAPGIMTGAIIAMARALGETAPLLLIGMVAFVNEIPTGPNQESTVLPVLIYKWFSGAERAWEPMTSAVILILLIFLILMNLAAVLVRRRFERRW